jgi:putative redox protein
MLRCNMLRRRNLESALENGFTGTKIHADARKGGACTMECTIHWTPGTGMGFVAETGSGHFLTMDGAPDGGGRNLAPRPMETVLAGTGGCTAYDVVLILKRGRHDVRGCQVKLTSERAAQDPKVFTKIHMHFTVTARGVPAAAVERAIALSHDKYCSASIMLGKTAEITTSFELVEA